MRIDMAKTNGKKPGQVLREYREGRGVAPDAFAKQLGVAESTLRSMENGTRPITPQRAVEIEERTSGGLTRQKILPELFEAKAA